ncbi:phospholipase/carboxylesterase [Cryptosporidium felis]|nr:phospholipase/carboxylesterase [Cryptosporidium felis]
MSGSEILRSESQRWTLQCVACRLLLLAVSLLLLVVILVWAFQEKLLFFPKVSGKGDLASNVTGFRHPNERRINSEDVTLVTDDGVKLHCWFMVHKEFDRYSTRSETVIMDPHFREECAGEMGEEEEEDQTAGGSRVRRAPRLMRRYFREYAEKYEKQKKVPTIIYFHGNAGNIGHRLPQFSELYDFTGVNIFAVSYRGYGDSEGTPSEEGFYLDAKAAIEYVSSKTSYVDKDKIFLFGHSIGGAVAIDLATKFSVAGLIIENTFTNISSVAFRIYPLFRYLFLFFKAIQRLKFDSISKIHKVKAPVLFTVGSKDLITPPSNSAELFRKLGHPRSPFSRIYTVPEGTHNDTWYKGGMKYYRVILEFIYNVIDSKGAKDDSNDLEDILASGGGGAPKLRQRNKTGDQGETRS